ncbi:MAG: hypothetical protein Q8L87_04685 [Anaerolineales bacterium]|nr:hypothetical protein [Anaerolineales bacterium]
MFFKETLRQAQGKPSTGSGQAFGTVYAIPRLLRRYRKFADKKPTTLKCDPAPVFVFLNG